MNPILPRVIAYTDGSSWEKDGRYAGGYGCVLISVNHKTAKFIKGCFVADFTSSTHVELIAVKMTLQELTKKSNIVIITDRPEFKSKFKGWKQGRFYQGKPHLNREVESIMLAARKHNVRIEYVKGHNGEKWNEKCHAMALKAMRDAMHRDKTYHVSEYFSLGE